MPQQTYTLTVTLTDSLDNRYLISFNNEASHHITVDELDQLRDRSINAAWLSFEHEARQLGESIFDMLDGTGGVFRDKIQIALQNGVSLTINLKLPPLLDAVPFEIILDNKTGQFLLQNGNIHLIRRVNDNNRKHTVIPQKRPLRTLFMACSPHDSGNRVLSFETEESAILKATEKFPMELDVEDTGSLEGLRQAIYQKAGYENPENVETYDIVHITGHAGVINPEGPIFQMEDEVGKTCQVTPDHLWEGALHDFTPKLLFLSGCSTAKTDKVNDKPSFARSMVAKGVPFVLGWALPVGDSHATAMASILYRHLAAGVRLDKSIAEVRREMASNIGAWGLLRVFADGSDCAALIAPGQKTHPKKYILRHKSLVVNEVRVLAEGFVGRRKQIQEGLRVLRSQCDEYGVLITGTAGVGKSCYAGRLTERFSSHHLIVIHGPLTAAKLFPQLRKCFEEQGIGKGLEILNNTAIDECEKMKALCRTVFKEKEYLFLLDDFEQNLEPHGNSYKVKSDALPLAKVLIGCISWCEWKTLLIITCRYPFVIETDGSDIVKGNCRNIPLLAMRNADLDKKVNLLNAINRSSNKDLYIETGKGNPRLLEWLEIIAEKEIDYNIEKLREEVAGKSEEFVNKYLADIMARAQGEEFRRFLKRASVYKTPVPESAYEEIGDVKYLETGTGLTLFEKENDSECGTVYWVTPVIRDKYWGELDESEQRELHAIAYNFYSRKLKVVEDPLKYPAELAVAAEHALACDKVIEACWFAVRLGDYYDNLLLYKEKIRVQQRIADRIDSVIESKAIDQKNGDVSILLNNLGFTCDDLGEHQKAIEYYKKSLSIDIAVYGEKHPNVATGYNNIGESWKELGDPQKAIAFYEKALAIDTALCGENHPNTATDYNNIGTACYHFGDYQKAIGYFEKAIVILIGVFGEQHPNAALSYNNIGLAYNELGEHQKAIEYYKKSLAIAMALFGERHPNVALTYNNIGLAWCDFGDPQKAIRYFEKALAIDLAVFGEKHPSVARSYNNIGVAWKDLSNLQKAIGYYEKAFEIGIALFGEKHPTIAIRYNNIGVVWKDLGNPQKAIGYFEKALAIDLAVFGEQYPNVAKTYNNIGATWITLGDPQKAIEYYEKALAIDLAVFGEQHPNIAIRYNNIGMACINFGNSQKAIEYYEKSLKIFTTFYGPDHPSTRTVRENLGSAQQAVDEKFS